MAEILNICALSGCGKPIIQNPHGGACRKYCCDRHRDRDHGIVSRLDYRKKVQKAARERENRVCELHALLKTDREIAEQVGVCVKTVAADRKRLGLADNRYKSPTRQEKLRQCALARNWGTDPERIRLAKEGARATQKAFATASGWPEDSSISEVKILNLLAGVGLPVTRYEIMSALKMSPRVSVILSQLEARGLVLRIRNARKTSNGPCLLSLFMLGTSALQILKDKSHVETPTEARPGTDCCVAAGESRGSSASQPHVRDAQRGQRG